MDELEELKKRKLMELQQNQQEAMQGQAEKQQLQNQIEQLEILVKQFLTKEALQRYSNLKIVHTEKAIKVLAVLGQMIQAGQIKSQVNDVQFKEILKRLEPPKKEFKIHRK